MRISATVALVCAAPLLLPTTASAQRTDCERDKLLASYSANYHMVRKAHGTRAPGRNIRKWGMSRRHASTCRQIRRSRATLRRMRHRGDYLLNASRPYRPPAGTSTLRATGAPLSAIRACESGGNYNAVSPSGQYRGGYQFDYGTWASVGGSGDPAAASPAEQDRRAAMLYAQRGSAPWPVCGS